MTHRNLEGSNVCSVEGVQLFPVRMYITIANRITALPHADIRSSMSFQPKQKLQYRRAVSCDVTFHSILHFSSLAQSDLHFHATPARGKSTTPLSHRNAVHHVTTILHASSSKCARMGPRLLRSYHHAIHHSAPKTLAGIMPIR